MQLPLLMLPLVCTLHFASCTVPSLVFFDLPPLRMLTGLSRLRRRPDIRVFFFSPGLCLALHLLVRCLVIALSLRCKDMLQLTLV